MKKLNLTLLILIVLLMATEIFWVKRNVEALNTKMNKKDLPEHGLLIVAPSDPAFDDLMTEYLKGTSLELAAALKPSSVFIRNIGKQSVVGVKLKWECKRADGNIIIKQVAEASPSVLMEEGALDHRAALDKALIKIKPGTTRFFSLVKSSQTLGESQTGQPEQSSSFKLINTELAQYSEIGISLDGVFFDDGTFAGSDSMGYFAEMKAMIDARYDLLKEVETDLQGGKSLDEIFNSLETLAHGSKIELGENPTPSDRYKYYKQMFAREPLGIKKALVDNHERRQALANRGKKLSKSWAKLRKL